MSDANVAAVQRKLGERAAVGLRKYGTTTERGDLTRLDWLRHLQEELMDAAVYIEAAIANAEGDRKDAERYRWLREGDNDEPCMRYSHDGSPVPVLDPDETSPAFLLRLDELDAVVDAEMAAEADRWELTEAGRAMRGGK